MYSPPMSEFHLEKAELMYLSRISTHISSQCNVIYIYIFCLYAFIPLKHTYYNVISLCNSLSYKDVLLYSFSYCASFGITTRGKSSDFEQIHPFFLCCMTVFFACCPVRGAPFSFLFTPPYPSFSAHPFLAFLTSHHHLITHYNPPLI